MVNTELLNHTHMPLVRAMAKSLPPHLAHKSALALVLAPVDTSYAAVQAIRQVHDKAYDRWPPHINLLYPFLAQPSRDLDVILARVQGAVDELPPIAPSRFDTLGHFVHSKKSSTVFLAPRGDVGQAIERLQAALQAAFPECNHDTRPFVPHLTLGQAAGGKQAAEALVARMDNVLREHMPSKTTKDEGDDVDEALFNAMANAAITTTTQEDPFRKATADPTTPWSYEWTVARVVVLERQGFADPFHIVGEVPLSTVPNPKSS
ncbi:Aste57867_18141 [Aphanomyces stellatus]|uniref:Aste57867_18141 protein n=1 Tax=Aphanomyces stellatus TaxID=120398 RepID=A0A485L9K2_9STRA|nr:hypothetical protein As57867_018079 [Aphanomyces stellatus]VFT94879.1 Aste57867_18141 [Aphanomyces stellatus]